MPLQEPEFLVRFRSGAGSFNDGSALYQTINGMVSRRFHKRRRTAIYGNTTNHGSSMCGLFFSFTLKSTPQHSKPKTMSAKASDESPLYYRTPTHARVDSIMGARSSCSDSIYTGSVLRLNEKHHSLNDIDYQDSKPSISSHSQDGHNNSLDHIAVRRLLLARKPSNSQLYARSRLSERRRPRSSPLTNVGTSVELKVL